LLVLLDFLLVVVAVVLGRCIRHGWRAWGHFVPRKERYIRS
jgi:hypothetical protein